MPACINIGIMNRYHCVGCVFVSPKPHNSDSGHWLLGLFKSGEVVLGQGHPIADTSLISEVFRIHGIYRAPILIKT